MTKLEKEKFDIEEQIGKSRSNVSNLDKLINYAVNLASKLHKTWELGEYVDKQNLQRTVFPSGLQYDRKTDMYLTPRVNRVFEFISYLSGKYEEKKEGSFEDYLENSHLVPRRGLEPLSLAAYAPQTYVYTNSTTWAIVIESNGKLHKCLSGGGYKNTKFNVLNLVHNPASKIKIAYENYPLYSVALCPARLLQQPGLWPAG